MTDEIETPPKVLVVLSQAQQERAQQLRGERYRVVVPAGAQRLLLPEFGELSSWAAQFVAKYGPSPGSVYVQCPHDHDLYVLREDAELAFEREKLRRFSELCKILGATRVVSDTRNLQVRAESIRRSGGLRKKVAPKNVFAVDASVDSDQKSEWERTLHVDDTYAGAEPDLMAAREFLVVRGLDRDAEIAGLVEARAGSNTMTSREVTIRYRGSKDQNLQIAAKVELPQVGASGKYSRSVKELKDVTVSLRVEFPSPQRRT